MKTLTDKRMIEILLAHLRDAVCDACHNTYACEIPGRGWENCAHCEQPRRIIKTAVMRMRQAA